MYCINSISYLSGSSVKINFVPFEDSKGPSVIGIPAALSLSIHSCRSSTWKARWTKSSGTWTDPESGKEHNSNSLGKKIVKKKVQEILRIFDSAEDNSVSRTSIAKTVTNKLGYPCDRKLVRRVLNKSRSSSQLEKKLTKIN